MPGFPKGNWPKAAIGGLVLLNIVLLALLVLREPSRPLTAEPAGSATDSPRSASTRSPTPTPTRGDRTPTATDADPIPTTTSTASATESSTNPVRSTRVLAVNSDKLAWRAAFGPCPTEPNIEVTRDGGRTWQRTAAGLKSVSRLRSYSESAVFAVGGTSKCDARYVATGGPEESWGPNERLLGETWYRLPDEPDRVHAPAGQLSNPCGDDLGDFAGLGDSNAAALCTNGQVRVTQDGGRRWRDLKGSDTGLAIGADDGVYAVAARRAGCDGIAVTVIDPGARRVDADKMHCAAVDRVAADQLAVSVRGQVIWLWAGSEVAVSTDRGRSWDRA